ncbi:MAG: hypothetical protein J6U03_05205 [Muribaculaceae bacterium]|nr:hypothetical protein [Muribaculaceae bacterium]
MKSLIAIIALAVVALLSVIGSVSCAKNTTTPADTLNQQNDKNRVNAAISDSDSIVRFRYERYVFENKTLQFESCFWMKTGPDNPMPKELAVLRPTYNWMKDKNLTAFFYNKFGSIFGMSYADVDADAALDSLLAGVRNIKFEDYAFTSLDKINKKKNCWALYIGLKSGKEISIVENTQSPRTADDEAIAALVGRIVDQQIALVEAEEPRAEYSRITFDKNGSVSQRICHMSDGTVLGGYDADDPLSSF